MEKADTIIAVLIEHAAAETAIKKLTAAGFEADHLGVIGKGYRTEENSSYFQGFRWSGRSPLWRSPWGPIPPAEPLRSFREGME